MKIKLDKSSFCVLDHVNTVGKIKIEEVAVKIIDVIFLKYVTMKKIFSHNI